MKLDSKLVDLTAFGASTVFAVIGADLLKSSITISDEARIIGAVFGIGLIIIGAGGFFWTLFLLTKKQDHNKKFGPID